jgi:serine/threonine-protein kinase
VDARADVYSLGVILFEALTGERPFEADTYNELILKIATAPMPKAAALNPSLDARLIAVVERAMARDPDLRFSDVKELALALEPFGGGMRFRTMQTLNRQGPTTGDRVVPAVEPTRADTSPASLPVATSDAVITPSTRPQPHGTRVAVAAAFLSLLSCAAVALYFINHPDQRNAATDDAKTSAAQGEVHTANAPTEGRAEDTNAATAADAPALNTAPAETRAAEPSALRSATSPTKGIRSSTGLAGSNPQGKKAQTSNPSLAKRGQHTGRAALSSALESAPTPPSAAPMVVRELPSDWEKRLDQHTDAPKAVHMPAGSIDLNDFR